MRANRFFIVLFVELPESQRVGLPVQFG